LTFVSAVLEGEHANFLKSHKYHDSSVHYQTRTLKGGGAAGLQPPKSKFKRNTDFVDTIITTALRDLPSAKISH
jgi:hypothetical protein